MRTLRVDETKLPMRNTFIVIFIYLQNEKKKKLKKRTLLETIHRFLTCVLTFTQQKPHIYSFLYCFSFSQFLATS